MRPVFWFILGAIAFPVVICLAGFLYMKTSAHGFSARAQPNGNGKVRRQSSEIDGYPPGRENETESRAEFAGSDRRRQSALGRSLRYLSRQ